MTCSRLQLLKLLTTKLWRDWQKPSVTSEYRRRRRCSSSSSKWIIIEGFRNIMWRRPWGRRWNWKVRQWGEGCNGSPRTTHTNARWSLNLYPRVLHLRSAAAWCQQLHLFRYAGPSVFPLQSSEFSCFSWLQLLCLESRSKQAWTLDIWTFSWCPGDPRLPRRGSTWNLWVSQSVVQFYNDVQQWGSYNQPSKLVQLDRVIVQRSIPARLVQVLWSSRSGYACTGRRPICGFQPIIPQSNCRKASAWAAEGAANTVYAS